LKRKKKTNLQSPGNLSRVYVPILLDIFRKKYQPRIKTIEFSLDDIRKSAEKLGIITRNPADVVYRMRSRTILPKEILSRGFAIIRQIGRGKYRLERAVSTLIECEPGEITEALDLTPLPVRRFFPENIAEIDEQGLLSIIHYCQLLKHFTGLTVYRLRSHVRKSVKGIGQAELDELDVGVALREDEVPVILPIEAKASDEPVNRVQIAAQVAFAQHYFEGHEVRPIAVKVDYDSVLHFLEFNATIEPADLRVLKSARYKLKLSEAQLLLIREAQSKERSALKLIKEFKEKK